MAPGDYCIDCGKAHDARTRCDTWRPDPELVRTVLAGGSSRTMASFDLGDRCQIVAGMVQAGLTGEDIRDRMKCSVRSVRSLAAHPLTQLCKLYTNETRNFRQELDLRDSELAGLRAALTSAESERDRYQRQLHNVIDADVVGEKVRFCPKDHAMVPWNTYTNPKTGKRSCRQCHADRQRELRAQQRANRGAHDLAPAATLTAGRAAESLAGVAACTTAPAGATLAAAQRAALAGAASI